MAIPAKPPVVVRQGFGAWLKDQRKRRGWSQEEAAKVAGISRIQWLRMESGESGTSFDTTPKIATALGVTEAEVNERAGLGRIEEIDEAREIQIILHRVPEAKRSEFMKAIRSMADWAAA